ncbi:MAG: hypothetical protein KBG21_04445 [Ignavibacteria bacterium]|nr:hypothetical protein [Ignavibacteria bacterium]
MKNLLAVILLAICTLVVTSNTSRSQDDSAPVWGVTVHGEYGIGFISGATVKVFDSSNNQIFSGVTQSSGEVAWHIPSVLVSGYYRIHVDEWSSHGASDKIIYYSAGSYFGEINIGPVL